MSRPGCTAGGAITSLVLSESQQVTADQAGVHMSVHKLRERTSRRAICAEALTNGTRIIHTHADCTQRGRARAINTIHHANVCIPSANTVQLPQHTKWPQEPWPVRGKPRQAPRRLIQRRWAMCVLQNAAGLPDHVSFHPPAAAAVDTVRWVRRLTPLPSRTHSAPPRPAAAPGSGIDQAARKATARRQSARRSAMDLR